MFAEQERLKDTGEGPFSKWQKWGPYVAERAWGTVREDYSSDGNAWVYFPYDLSYTKAYRWGEDGIAGFCDRYQVLVLAPAFWNEKDAVLKERLFGLNMYEGNHGEDVKEVYFHLDATPTHSYLKYLYKYPQAAFPYEQLREENRKRGRDQPEYELIDTGVFSDERYFDVEIEYAKKDPEDLCIKISVTNRGPDPAPFHLLMQLFFRNQWSWTGEPISKPIIRSGQGECLLVADDTAMPSMSNLSFDYHLGPRYLYGPPGGECLFTENETGLKDAFHRKVIRGEACQIQGTKACLHYLKPSIAPGERAEWFFRFCDRPHSHPLNEVNSVMEKRRKEADRFYESIYPASSSPEEKKLFRQALAGMVWNKQIYLYDVNRWLEGDNPHHPPPAERRQIRNVHWRHLNSMRILLMPDKWEYPWFAAWDHAFQCMAYGLLDIEYAKEQLWLLLFDQFQHPNGQIPAYEWEFSDLNPPVQALAVLYLYNLDGQKDRDFLERCFHKLLINFAWWVNKVDSQGNNVFEGGFLGFDNIALVDRSQKFPDGAVLQQSDGTGWMAIFSLNLMRIALLLSKENQVYESLATKFFEHYVYIAHAMKKRGNQDYELWSDRDGFFYDVLTYPDGTFSKFRIRSLVGLIPLFAVETLTEEEIEPFEEFHANFHWFIKNRKDLASSCIIPIEREGKEHFVLTPMHQQQLQSVLNYVWDPEEFRAPFGLRSMSRYHEKNPFVFQDKQVGYEPAESHYAVKGGNSNWRGPVWMPTTFLLIESLHKLSNAFGETLRIHVGQETVGLSEMAHVFTQKAISLFLPDSEGNRPVWGSSMSFQQQPAWKDCIPFYEYFNPDTGKGLGASHQTGWTALIANLIKNEW